MMFFRLCIKLFNLYLFPSLCAYCKNFLSISDVFCVDCKGKIFPIVSKKIDVTPSFSMTVFAISDYKDPLKKLILAKSWADSVASYQLGRLIVEMIPLNSIDCDLIVPIPLHWTRYAWRGFNQAEEIARVLSKKKKVPMKNLLKRIKRTPFQSKVAAFMRIENVKDAFKLNSSDDYHGKHIVIVDDLMTTGATLRAAAKTLLALKPRKVTVIVACRVL